MPEGQNNKGSQFPEIKKIHIFSIGDLVFHDREKSRVIAIERRFYANLKDEMQYQLIHLDNGVIVDNYESNIKPVIRVKSGESL